MNINNLKRKRIKETFYYEEEPIYVYNPTKEQQIELMELLLKNIDLNKKEININDKKITLKIFKELTNLTFPNDKKEIKEIFDDPSDLLLDINFSLNEIVTNLTTRIFKKIKIINKFYKSTGLTTNQIAEILVNTNTNQIINEVEKETKNKNSSVKKSKIRRQ